MTNDEKISRRAAMAGFEIAAKFFPGAEFFIRASSFIRHSSFGLRHSFVIRHSGFVIHSSFVIRASSFFPARRTMAKTRRVVARNPLPFFLPVQKTDADVLFRQPRPSGNACALIGD
jgi:hypothetical protein